VRIERGYSAVFDPNVVRDEVGIDMNDMEVNCIAGCYNCCHRKATPSRTAHNGIYQTELPARMELCTVHESLDAHLLNLCECVLECIECIMGQCTSVGLCWAYDVNLWPVAQTTSIRSCAW